MSGSSENTFASDVQGAGPACVLRLKVVPGSRRDQVVGTYGDRLKVKVAAPPEDGRANQAVCELLAKHLKIASRSVTIVSGQTNPEKTARVEGVSAEDATKALA
ncbi:MAG: DUF167 domain-containing protein [Phycisphaerales bacterium]